jgi:predicted ATPase
VSVAELVGRRDELAVLDAALSDTAAGAGRLVLVEGDAGVGKSRLIKAFTSRAATAGATVLRKLGLRSRIQAAALAHRQAADGS